MKRLILSALIIIALLPQGIAFASDISLAIYKLTIKISNNSTADDDVPVVFTGNTTAWMEIGYLNSEATNSAMKNSDGDDVPYMPGYVGYPWVTWVPYIGGNTYLNYYLYMGGAKDMKGEIRYFPGEGGMTVENSTSLDLNDNFSIIVKGWLDAIGSNKTIAFLPGSVRVYLASTGNITATMMSSPEKTVSIAGIESGEHRIMFYADGTDLWLIIDPETEEEVCNTIPLDGKEAPDGTSDWVFFEDYVMPYVEYIRIFID